MNSGNYILVADSHIREDSADHFFEMLEAIRRYAPKGVVFLGDIFELWIALDGYESEIHHRFLDWCRAAKPHFEVGFILGNHEFYVQERHRDAFTWMDENAHTTAGGIRFTHGDLINRDDRKYLFLRKVLRSWWVRFLLKITSRAIGPKVADRVRVSLKPTNLQHKRQLPLAYLEQYAENAAAENVQGIFMGHFHQHEILRFPEKRISAEILPAWDMAEEIVRLTPDLRTECGPWRKILSE